MRHSDKAAFKTIICTPSIDFRDLCIQGKTIKYSETFKPYSLKNS